MKVAIPVWSGRISPVFDVARNLLVVDMDGGVETSRSQESVNEMGLVPRARRVAQLGIQVLICGAISRPLEELLASAGIQLIPHTCGSVEEVLLAYKTGHFNDRTFLMPGCCGRRRKFRSRLRRNSAMSRGQGENR